MDKLTSLLAFLAALALATERITEIMKGLPLLSRWLVVEQSAGSSAEEFRKACIQIIAATVGSALAYAGRDQLSGFVPIPLSGLWPYLLLGVMASGGSAFWNRLLDTLSEINQQKQLLTQQMKSNPTSPLEAPKISPSPLIAREPEPTKTISSTDSPAALRLSTPAPTGNQLVQLARQHLGEKYVLSARVPKNVSHWNGPWNCSEFVSWLVFQVSGGLYGCDNDTADPMMAHAFTGYWNRDAQSRGQIITIEQAARTPGAAVLRLPQPGATGHIVISDGQNGTIEAHSPNDGVIAFTLSGRRWDLAILVPTIAYGEGPMVAVSPPSTTIYRLKQPFMTGDKVAQIQEKLKAAGCDPGPLDGNFGPYTHAAVVAFQHLHGLVPDGEVGAETAAALGIQL